MTDEDVPTPFEWAGGAGAVRGLIDRFYDRGTRLAMHHSRPGADVNARARVPRWGWGVAPPYVPEQS